MLNIAYKNLRLVKTFTSQLGSFIIVLLYKLKLRNK